MGQRLGGGQKFANFVILAQFYELSIIPCVSSFWTHFSALSHFSPFRGVMKIRIAVTLTLVVLG